MTIVAAYLPLNGFKHTIAVLGRQYSYNMKASRQSLVVFDLGKAPTSFQLCFYDLAYINIGASGLLAESDCASILAALEKEGFAKKAQVSVVAENTVVCNDAFFKFSEIAPKALNDALLWLAKEETAEKPSSFIDKIEAVFLSRMYHLGVKESEDFNWHVIASEIHPEKESHLNTLLTSHSVFLNNP